MTTKYLDGVQQVEDTIKQFVTIASGTINVGVGSSSAFTTTINQPSPIYRNYVFVFVNKTGQTINLGYVLGKQKISNVPLPNTPNSTAITLKSYTLNVLATGTGTGAIDLTNEEPNPFVLGNCTIQLNVAAALTVAGTIDWALIGY
jgi:hypothetical protein